MELNDKLIYASDIRKAILRQEPRLAYLVEGVRAVDAKPVIHAHWIKASSKEWGFYEEQCSNCEMWSMGTNKNYCPNCGAKMEVEVECADE